MRDPHARGLAAGSRRHRQREAGRAIIRALRQAPGHTATYDALRVALVADAPPAARHAIADFNRAFAALYQLRVVAQVRSPDGRAWRLLPRVRS